MRNFRQRIKLQQFRNHQARPHLLLLLLVRVEIHHRQGHREQQLTSVERVRVREREQYTNVVLCGRHVAHTIAWQHVANSFNVAHCLAT